MKKIPLEIVRSTEFYVVKNAGNPVVMENDMTHRPLVHCTSCGIETTNQPEGDGCHSCLRGVMRLVG